MGRLVGTLRADKRTKRLVTRLRTGDIALIQHPDLDAIAARSLADRRPGAVINVAPFITGRYPNQGPTVLMEAGIPMIEIDSGSFFEEASGYEGSAATVDDGVIRIREGLTANGMILERSQIDSRLEAARGNLSVELDAFARNTLAYLEGEKALLLDPVEIPRVSTKLRQRHVLIVVRGEGYREDLRTIEEYLRDVRPATIGVDGGADALLELGIRPDIILGDMDSVSDAALRCGAELVVHGYARGEREAPGLRRIETLGLTAQVFHVPGTSEDAALLLADGAGASLIVAVGTHFSLEDFLDKGRGGMASTFLVRLRIGAKLVDAKGIGRLWSSRRKPATMEIIAIVAAALFPIIVVAAGSPFLQALAVAIRLWFRSVTGLR